MSGEVKFQGPGSLSTCYFTIRGSGNSIWSTSGGTGALQAFASGNWADYAIDATEQGVSNFFVGNFPAAVPPGLYDVQAKQQLGVGALQTDPGVAVGEVNWNGTGAVGLTDLATSGQLGQLQPMRIAKGVQIPNFLFYLVSSADHVTPFTSGVCSGQIARDAGSFGALQSGAFTEVGQGFYRVQALTSGDLNCVTAALLFNAAGISGGTSDPRAFSLVTQRVSGQQ